MSTGQTFLHPALPYCHSHLHHHILLVDTSPNGKFRGIQQVSNQLSNLYRNNTQAWTRLIRSRDPWLMTLMSTLITLQRLECLEYKIPICVEHTSGHWIPIHSRDTSHDFTKTNKPPKGVEVPNCLIPNTRSGRTTDKNIYLNMTLCRYGYINV